MRRMKDLPPVDVVVYGLAKAQAPQPIEQSIGSFGIAPKKGKVNRRGNLSR